ncbi:MAG TPA: 50S ribosomal protein L31 [Gaiellaceae bacterium]
MTQHPNLHLVDLRCASCGAEFAVRTTAESISIEICSKCHPAYTGRARSLASGDRVERFNRRRARAAA